MNRGGTQDRSGNRGRSSSRLNGGEAPQDGLLVAHFPFTPAVMSERLVARQLLAVATKLAHCSGDQESIEDIRSSALAKAASLGPEFATEAKCCISLLADLAAQGWEVRVNGACIDIAAPDASGSQEQRKAQVRAGHHVGRDAQLATPPVRRFIAELERPRPFKGAWYSIFSVMGDGRELAALCDEVAALPEDQREAAVASCVEPYVQTVSTDAVCEITGLRLIDIWRYFRHTWTTAYKSTPGRKMYFLIRDRAAPCHPDRLGSRASSHLASTNWLVLVEHRDIAGRRLSQPSDSPVAAPCGQIKSIYPPEVAGRLRATPTPTVSGFDKVGSAAPRLGRRDGPLDGARPAGLVRRLPGRIRPDVRADFRNGKRRATLIFLSASRQCFSPSLRARSI